ncbi:cytochrome ubiquinol oxidase subunit I [Paenibacillus sp. DMB20]|uniref:cytochrome ubiquinol oxidase subunit I n=1 Tax=Paenibacillus sp. DMB20 TaxID=1642570 RepID=UPI000B12B751
MSSLDPVMMSRILTGVTLFVHIVLATIGVGIPVMLALAEWRGVHTGDGHYTLLARRWARGYVITVAVGVVTGTAIGLQLSLLWPTFMRVAGKAIALPLFMETFAFFRGGHIFGNISIYLGSLQKQIHPFAAFDSRGDRRLRFRFFYYEHECVHESAAGV